MAKKRLVSDRIQTQTEINRRHQDRISAIDHDLNEAIEKIDWVRRNKAEKSFWDWVLTYGYPQLLAYHPPERSKDVMDKLESSLQQSKPMQLQLSRGQGKSVLAQLFILYLIATGKRQYPVIISANARASAQLLADIHRFVIEADTPFSTDYPTLSTPWIVCAGSYRRRMTYNGLPITISKTSSDLSFADIRIDGQPGLAHISARSITGGLRGMRKGSIRPDYILLDDLLTDEDTTEEATNKLLDTIKKSVLNLGGQTQKLPCVMTSTPLAPDDLTQKIKADKNWTTLCYPSIISWGDIETQTFRDYWQMYDDELLEDKPHTESDEFWRSHQAEMEDGFTLYNPLCFDPSENVSGVQAVLQKRRLIGPDAFDCEYQLRPQKYSFAVDVTPQDVLAKIGSTSILEIPVDTQMTVASIDLNVSHCITTVIVAWDKNLTGTVIFHDIHKCRIPSTLPETEYHRQVYQLLTDYAQKLKAFNLKNLMLAIDAGGANFSAVCDFCRNSKTIVGLQACAFVGRASHIWNPNVRSKIRTAIGRTILCADDTKRWVAWDSDFCKMQILKALKAAPLSQGGIMLYNASPKEHQEFATQATNERLLYIQHQSNGRDIYHYKTKSAIDHDFEDCLSQAYAAAQQQGLVETSTQTSGSIKRRLPQRKRIKII